MFAMVCVIRKEREIKEKGMGEVEFGKDGKSREQGKYPSWKKSRFSCKFTSDEQRLYNQKDGWVGVVGVSKDEM